MPDNSLKHSRNIAESFARTWDGHVSSVTLAYEGKSRGEVKVPAIFVERGPEVKKPGGKPVDETIGTNVVLADHNRRVLSWDQAPLGSSTRVTGLMWTIPVFDTAGRRLYHAIDVEQKYLVRGVEVKSLKILPQATSKP